MFKEYYTNEEDLVKYFTDAFPNKRLLTLENIKKLLSYHIYNKHPNSNIDNSEYENIDEILDIIKQRLGSLDRWSFETGSLWWGFAPHFVPSNGSEASPRGGQWAF
jgi:hypothetical protein